MAKHLGLELELWVLISLHQQLLKTMEDRQEREHLSQDWTEGLRRVGLLSGVTAGVTSNDTQWDQNLACSSKNVPQHVSEMQKCTPARLRNLGRLLQPPEISWQRASSPLIKPAGSQTGCEGFITLFLLSPAATLNWTQEGQKLFTRGRGINFLFFKGNPAKSWISNGMSPPATGMQPRYNYLDVF